VPPSRFEIQRLTQLEEQLEILYEKRHAFETDIAISASRDAKFELQQRLKREVLPSLRRTEQEYARLLAGAVEPAQLPEPEAQAVVEDVREALASHERAASGERSEELHRLLTDLCTKLNEPGKAAVAKLKVILPVIPLIASYELELDTESFVTQAWQRLKGLFRRAVANYPASDQTMGQTSVTGPLETSPMAHSPSTPQRATEVFFSYAHHDEPLRNELAKHLRLMERQGVIAAWHDRQIPAGSEWAGTIDAHLQTAHIILLLVSADFLASNYCYDIEMRQAMARHEAGEARVIPIILRPVDWHSARFGKLQALPKDGRPVTSWLNRDEAFVDIARGIRSVAEGAVSSLAPARPDPAVEPLRTNSIGMEFMRIPAGTFRMGSTDADAEAIDAEKPVHDVTISQPFYLGKYPVTQAQWEAVMGNNPSHFTGNPNRPVENVSWDDVHAFLRKLNEREGAGDYRLPTETQWEYACRAGTITPRYHQDITAMAWCNRNSNGQTQPVGQKLPNAWGLYDMLGNVWEWCHDGLREYTTDGAEDPLGPTDAGADRVFRGGSWDDPARVVRAAARDRDLPCNRHDHLGFRCVS
jgi:formylglycine-generating enzyme required for sulfatase activity